MLITATVLSTSCGKDSIADLCKESCSNAVPYYERCRDAESDAFDPSDCTAACLANAEENEDLGCADQHKNWVSCMNDLNWTSLGCDPNPGSSACEDTAIKLDACRDAAPGDSEIYIDP